MGGENRNTDAIQSHATDEDYGVILAVSNESSDLERQHIERLLAMRVDGLLLSVSRQPADREIYRMVRTMDVPPVFFDRRLDGETFSSVTVDDFDGARRAVDRLIKSGYRKIAHIAGSDDTAIGRDRRSGYEEAVGLLLEEIRAQEEGDEISPRHVTLETRLMVPGDRAEPMRTRLDLRSGSPTQTDFR